MIENGIIIGGKVYELKKASGNVCRQCDLREVCNIDLEPCKLYDEGNFEDDVTFVHFKLREEEPKKVYKTNKAPWG